ncbi:MAG: Gfo/Idh/MocA family oxidoreductase [Ruminococcaceae bacterium]|nr:Gfo/Idh/MocA family oxidoreductase [Oscillospiraceae bacterium]
MKKIKIALVGFGGIARSHYISLEALKKADLPIELVAICDANISQFTASVTINSGGFEITLPKELHLYTNADEMLAKEDFDMVDICLPTFLHKDFTVKFLKAGKHVLCEKPMALSSKDCEEMLLAAKESERQLMIGLCLRFSPPYLYLKELIEQKAYGNLSYISMERLSVSPTWSAGNWLQAEEKSGGMLLDMHIHDIDMARFLLGEPQSVSTVTCKQIPHYHTESTRLYYKNTVVEVKALQQAHPDVPFFVGFDARFEKATVRMEQNTVRVFPDGAEAFTPTLDTTNPISNEIEYFVNLLLSNASNTKNSPADSAKTVKLIELLRESSGHGGIQLPFLL